MLRCKSPTRQARRDVTSETGPEVQTDALAFHPEHAGKSAVHSNKEVPGGNGERPHTLILGCNCWNRLYYGKSSPLTLHTGTTSHPPQRFSVLGPSMKRQNQSSTHITRRA